MGEELLQLRIDKALLNEIVKYAQLEDMSVAKVVVKALTKYLSETTERLSSTHIEKIIEYNRMTIFVISEHINEYNKPYVATYNGMSYGKFWKFKYTCSAKTEEKAINKLIKKYPMPQSNKTENWIRT